MVLYFRFEIEMYDKEPYGLILRCQLDGFSALESWLKQ